MNATHAKQSHGLSVHQVLAHGYLVYLAAIVAGFGASYFWPENFSFPLESPFGLVLIFLGTIIVYWAQSASGKTSHHRNVPKEELSADYFFVGPYVYSRSPTQYGLFLMAFGLALLYGSLYMAITTVLALLIGRLFIIPHEESHLQEKYGKAYSDYKKKVRF